MENNRNDKLQAYFEEEHHFKAAINTLRNLACSLPFEETYKWNFPTYTYNGKNIMAICRFKHHFGLWFFNGLALKDHQKVLTNAQPGKTKTMRHWKFTNDQALPQEVLLDYMKEALSVESAV